MAFLLQLVGTVRSDSCLDCLSFYTRVDFYQLAGCPETKSGLPWLSLTSRDLAGQFNLLINPETYRKIIKPRHKKIMDFIKARSKAKIFFHSCGAIREIIPDMIEVGIDIINPVQVSAVGMESGALKRDFGK